MPTENIFDWSTVATDNGSADAAVPWPEGTMTLAQINNSSRSEMAAHAKYRDLMKGTIVTGGTANAQTFSSGYSFTGAPPTGMRVRLKIGPADNTGPMTLNMDSIGELPVKTQALNDLEPGQVRVNRYGDFIFDGTQWILLTETRTMTEVLQESNSILISETVALSSPQIDIDLTSFDANFNEYLLVITDLVSGTANTICNMRLSTDGTTFLSGASDYRYCSQRLNAVGPGMDNAGSFGIDRIPMDNSSFPVDDRKSASGEVRIFRPNAATATNLWWTLQYRNQAQTNFFVWKGAGCKKAASAVKAIRFYMTGSTGGPPPVAPTIHKGKFQLYGLRNNVVLRAAGAQYHYSGTAANFV